MKCQKCTKAATLHITEVLGEEQFEELHLCEECAHKYLYEPQKAGTPKAAPALQGDEGEELLPLLENIHGETRHSGKAPRRLPQTKQTQSELVQLRKQLLQAVNKEAYEEAARIRDRIRKIEEG